MKSDTKNSNRDINRQNKASTVIDALLHPLVAQYLIKETGKIVCDVLETELELSPPTKCKLEYVAKLATNTEEVVHIASYKHCKSSSYIKCGSIHLAKVEHRNLKNAIRFDEFSTLPKRMPHYTPRILAYQTLVHNTPRSSCTIINTIQQMI